MAKSKAQRRAARQARKAAKRAARQSGAPKPSKSALRKITRQTIKKSSAPSNKQKTQNYIRKIISDGKVSKSEVNKAIKKGINPDRIKGAAEKYTKPGNPFSRQPGLKGLSKTPQSITITPGAGKLIGRGVAGIRPKTTLPTPSPQGQGQGPEPGPEVNPYQAQFDAYDAALAQMQDQLAASADFAAQFEEMAAEQQAQYQAQLQEMQSQQSLAMDELTARFEEQERQRLLTSQTQEANMARSSLTPDFSIGGRQSDLYGTSGFKRRRKIRPATIAQGIAPTTPISAVGAAGATNGNLLNV